MLEVNNINYIRNERFIFKDISFKLNSGDFLLVVGENGVGKTTLLKFVCCLLNGDGDIIWNGINVENCFKDYMNDLIFLGRQNLQLSLTSIENLFFYVSLYEKKQILSIKEALNNFNLFYCLNKKCGELSYGQRQKVFLSKLLLLSNKLWLLDEPFSFLDYNGIDCIFNVMSNFISKGGIIIMTSHYLIKKVSNYFNTSNLYLNFN